MTGKADRKKILFIHDYPPIEGGGIEVSVFKTAKALASLGYQVTIATSRLSSETYVTSKNNIKREDITIVHVNDSAILKNEIDKTDIVHIYFTFSFRPASLYGLKYAVEKSKPTIFSFRTSYKHLQFSDFMKTSSLERSEKINMLKELLQKENVYISGPTIAVKESLEHLLLNKELFVINNGTDYALKKPAIAIDEIIEEVDVTYVGELSFMKGINYLIDAFRLFKEEGANYKLRMVGTGSDAQTIYTLVKHFDLEKSVYLTGYQPNEKIAQYLQKTKLYIQPSLTELWSNSVLEAMSLGVPVISTDVDGMKEMLNGGRYGELIRSGDAVSIHTSITKTLSEYKKRKALAITTQKAISTKYTLQNQIKAMCALYNQI